MQKSTMLFVVSIFLLIGGGFGILIGLLAFVGGATFGILGGSGAALLVGIAIVAAIVSLAVSGINIAAGIIGIRCHKLPETAETVIRWGKILIGLQAVSAVFSLFTSGLTLSAFTGFLLPVLYYVAGDQLKQMR